jgi:putative transposase
MDEYESLSHWKWECKYHVVFIRKGRRKVLYGDLRKYLGEVFRKLAEQKESRIEEGHLLPDHVHKMISIPPKYAVAQVIGFIKGKSAIHMARVYGGRKQNFVGQSFWARGYFVSTVGRNEELLRRLDPAPIASSMRNVIAKETRTDSSYGDRQSLSTTTLSSWQLSAGRVFTSGLISSQARHRTVG